MYDYSRSNVILMELQAFMKIVKYPLKYSTLDEDMNIKEY